MLAQSVMPAPVLAASSRPACPVDLGVLTVEITPELVNLCVNQTLSRTLLTSLTVFIVVLILYIFGGQGVHGFAFTLVIGTISGTYSTVYIATPLLIWMNQSKAEAKKGPPPGPAKRLEPV